MKLSFAEAEAVLAVARHGGFRAAGRSLGQTSSALSHAVASLENRLAVKLFNRTTRSVSLTAAGEQFVNGIGPALQSIEHTIDELGADAVNCFQAEAEADAEPFRGAGERPPFQEHASSFAGNEAPPGLVAGRRRSDCGTFPTIAATLCLALQPSTQE